jgi:hypothetical protein
MSKEIQVAEEIRRVTGVGGEREIKYDNKDLYKACTSLIMLLCCPSVPISIHIPIAYCPLCYVCGYFHLDCM